MRNFAENFGAGDIQAIMSETNLTQRKEEDKKTGKRDQSWDVTVPQTET